jgi:hypothetical protein
MAVQRRVVECCDPGCTYGYICISYNFPGHSCISHVKRAAKTEMGSGSACQLDRKELFISQFRHRLKG